MTNMISAALMLREGADRVEIRPRGHSMEPLIMDGQSVIVRRLSGAPEVGDFVLATVHGVLYLHKVLAVDGDRVQIGNNKGRVNGWTHRSKVWGYVPEF
jgi:phage repressor protein C with HTH and peptisase S24 domain